MAEEALGLKLQKFNNGIICLVHIVSGEYGRVVWETMMAAIPPNPLT